MIDEQEANELGPAAETARKRDATTLEAAGAELLVVGRLLIEGFQVYRAYANQPGYDLLVVDPKTRASVKVQVKSRVAEDSGPFIISHPDFDFVVFVRLNRGTKAERSRGKKGGKMDPKYFVLSKSMLCRSLRIEANTWKVKRHRVTMKMLGLSDAEGRWEVFDAIARG